MFTSTKLIVGLGNPGSQYENTKHNLGFWVVNELLLRLQLNRLAPLCKALVTRTEWHDSEVIFAKPMTYMNNSGQAVNMLVQKFDIFPQDLCVVYDDLNLDIGVLRMRKAGSDGGHNGMKSIIHHLGTQDFRVYAWESERWKEIGWITFSTNFPPSRGKISIGLSPVQLTLLKHL